MTTHTDLGIDEATFTASLRVIDHPWRPGQRCLGRTWGWTPDGLAQCDECSWVSRLREVGYPMPPHTVPIPAVTDELLMRMLREGLKRDDRFIHSVAWRWRYKNETFEAAIIRATAALDKEG